MFSFKSKVTRHSKRQSINIIWKEKTNITTRFRYDTDFKSTDREKKKEKENAKRKTKTMGERNTKHPRTMGSLEKV